MKMSRKLILLFSLMAFLTTALNSIYFCSSEMKALKESTASSLMAVGNKMIVEIEQHVLMMDYALEGMTADTDFMNALYVIWQQSGQADNISCFLTAQNLISSTLYHNPINENFFRVSVFNRDGFFLSNRFEKNDTVVSLSDEAREIIASLDWLTLADSHVFQRHLIAPHQDAWTSARHEQVFSAVRAAVWRGQNIGYFEVTTLASELERIFSATGMEGLTVQAVFDDGRVLYRAPDDPADYSGITCTGMINYKLPQGGESLVVVLHNKWLGINVYVAQSMTVHNQSVQALIARYALIAAIILAMAVLLIIIISLRLTESIRLLTHKVRMLPVNDMLLRLDEPAAASMVTDRSNGEIYELERVFNELITRLQVSLRNEIIMRECNLQAQLNALQTQINPHFIYNTLNIVSAKSMECGNEEIIEICDQFAQMLRYSTDLCSKTATLGEEISHVRRYLMLAKARYEDRLYFGICVPSEMEQLVVPKLILQPIVENALTHGYDHAMQPMHISIEGICTGEEWSLVIRDDGQGFPPDMLRELRATFKQIEEGTSFDSQGTGGHIGLVNTYLRLFYYSQGKIRLKLSNNHGAVVELTIPYQREGAS